IRRQRLARDCERAGIAIETQHAAGPGVEECATVPTKADRAVDEQAATRRGQKVQHFRNHHGLVLHCGQIPNSESALASSSVKGSRCIFATNRSWFQTSSKSTWPSTSTSPDMPADSR